MLLEIHHHCSKSATNDFWQLAKEAFPRLHRAKINEMVPQNIPKFPYQREKLQKAKVPKINLKIGYLNKETNEEVVVEGDKTPVSRFNPQLFQKQYEVATVEVHKNLIIYDTFSFSSLSRLKILDRKDMKA